MRLAQIDGGIVVNVIEVDLTAIPDWADGWPDAGEAGPGWSYVDGIFAPHAGDEGNALNAERAAMVLTDIQFAMIAAQAGFMTAAEAEAWVGSGTLPAVALAAIAMLPEADQSAARIRFTGARTIARLDPFVPLLQAAADLTGAQVDDLFRQGAML